MCFSTMSLGSDGKHDHSEWVKSVTKTNLATASYDAPGDSVSASVSESQGSRVADPSMDIFHT